ncbi:PPE family protein [Mycolicibacter minnesotensis]
MLDFGALPPEINSTRMYTGPGSGPMMAAAAAWDDITMQMESVATEYAATISSLQGQLWSGPASQAMATAAAGYMAWASATAVQAEQTAIQIRAVASAFEVAFAATVPPAAVAANRAQLAMLVATNFFGQNVLAIAATEAVYAEMWAQDATAMYGYAGAAAAAPELTPFQRPPETTDQVGQFTQHAAVARAAADALATDPQMPVSELISGAPDQSQILTAAQPQPSQLGVAQASPPPETWPIIAQFALVGPSLGVLGVAQQVVFTTGSQGIFGMAILNSQTQPAAGHTPNLPNGAPASPEFPRAVLATEGKAASIGKLSVPPNWVTATQPTGADKPAEGTLRQAAARAVPEAAASRTPVAMLGPMDRQAARNNGNPVYRLRDRRFWMPRPPAAG